jgi:hypothetical protein
LLRKDGLVGARRNGRSMHYSLTGAEARAVILLLHHLYCAPAQQRAQADPPGA